MTLTRETKTTVGMACTVVVCAISITTFVNGKLSNIERELQGMSARIDNNETRMNARIESNESAVTKLFTLSAASEQALRMAIENPGFRVPDPRDPNKIIEVRSKLDK